MIINRYYFAFILHLIILSGLNSQKVTVSREISIKNNYAYDILPNIGDHIIFYHDRGIENTFEIYDKNLRYVNTITPEFEKEIYNLQAYYLWIQYFIFIIPIERKVMYILRFASTTKMYTSRTQ
ncbi:MAG: hypothetical protein IPL08_19505 [Saprospiraceae bacterium]|nr:hypothetical protein [Saprospiraceae bacterium]